MESQNPANQKGAVGVGVRKISKQELSDAASFGVQAMLAVPEEDDRAWFLLTNVPVLHNVWAYVCLILNVIIPGSGTMLCSCLGD